MHHFQNKDQAFSECKSSELKMSVKTEIKNQTAVVTLSRPEVHNAFNDETISALTKTFSDLDKNENIRTIILQAEGKSFCAGADLSWMKSTVNFTYDENIEDGKCLAKMFKTIYECSKPVLGRVHGTAIGGGIGLVSVCDITCALDTAKFSLSEVKIGLIPAVISPFVLEKISLSEAKRYFLTGERFDANEAKRIGLISETADSIENLDRKINDWVQNILSGGKEAIKICKKMIQEISSMNLNESLELTAKQIAKLRVGKEAQEGMQAFLEKRAPNWK